MTDDMEVGDTFKGAQLPIPCPCGAKLAYSVGEDGRPNGILHELPVCEDFEKREPADYLAWVRQKHVS